MTNARELEHTLKNHLAIILGFAELLLQDAAPDDPRRRGFRGNPQGRGGRGRDRLGASARERCERSPPVLLVIDDEPGILALVERAVRSTGYRVVSHTSARDALAMMPSRARRTSPSSICRCRSSAGSTSCARSGRRSRNAASS